MQPDTTLLSSTSLFAGFSAAELAALLPSLPAQLRTYPRGAVLLHAGDENREVGLVLSGFIEAGKTSRGGVGFTVSRLGPGDAFGDVLAGGEGPSPVTLSTPTGCTVLRFPYLRLLQGSAQGDLQRRLLQNLVRVVSAKYFALQARLDLLLIRSLRGRIASYLLGEMDAAGRPTFQIPFDRAALAAYLGCERSALSRELSRMAKAGLVDTFRASFRILDEAGLRAAAG